MLNRSKFPEYIVKAREIKSKSIITRSNLPDADYVINPYTGCVHSCLYCYARFMKRFTGHREPWGRFIDVKINAADLIPEKTSRYEGRSIYMSSVTDPYNPPERKYEITRGILKRLIPLKPYLAIQTKSDLVLRDIDILTRFRNCEAGLTMTTIDDSIRREIEPHTSSVRKRITALKNLKDAGIKTYVFIGPILPYVTEWKEIIKSTKNFTDLYMFENLNIAGSVWSSVVKWLREKHRSLIPKYRRIYFTKSSYWDKVERDIRRFCTEQEVNAKIYFHHGR